MWFSAETRARFEPWLLALLILAGAIGARWLHAEASGHGVADLERFAVTSGISVEGWPHHPFLLEWVRGDGQVFAAFAADPLKGGGRVSDSTHRFTRAGYSWVAAAVTLGHAPWVPYGLLVVNGAAVLFVAYVTWRKREEYGARVWWLLVNPALYIGFLGDTSETLGIALLVAALISGSVLAAALLGTVRPSFLVGVARNPRLLVIGLIVAAGMRLFAAQLFESPATSGFYNITWPLVGYIQVPSLTAALVALAAIVTLAIGVLRRRISWVLAGLLVLTFAAPIHLSGQINTVRAAGLLPVLWALDPAPASAEKEEEGRKPALSPLASR